MNLLFCISFHKTVSWAGVSSLWNLIITFLSFYFVLVYMLLIAVFMILVALFVFFPFLMILGAFLGFFLAFVLGSGTLISYFINKKSHRIPTLYNLIYRLLGLSTVFLALGIGMEALGWNRFLDWWLSKGGLNEQETVEMLVEFFWSLIPLQNWGLFITFLSYALLLFTKFRGWIKDFSVVVGSVLLFIFMLFSYGLIFF